MERKLLIFILFFFVSRQTGRKQCKSVKASRIQGTIFHHWIDTNENIVVSSSNHRRRRDAGKYRAPERQREPSARECTGINFRFNVHARTRIFSSDFRVTSSTIIHPIE